MEKKISVIIPVYNVEKYIRECLDSVLEQSLKDIEIVCVNDGSTDGSRGVLSEYEAGDKRIIVLDKENGGLSSARNSGIDIAQGKYVLFLDSDDLLNSEEALSILYDKAEKEVLDQLYFDAEVFFENEEVKTQNSNYIEYYKRKKNYPDVMTGKELFSELQTNWDFKPNACMQLLRRRFLIDNKLTFCEGILHEDEVFTLECATLAQRAAYIDAAYLKRRIRGNSIMTSAQKAGSIYGYYYGIEQLLEFAQHHLSVHDTLFTDLYLQRVLVLMESSARLFAKVSETDKEEILDGVEKDRQFTFAADMKAWQKNISLKEKLDSVRCEKKAVQDEKKVIQGYAVVFDSWTDISSWGEIWKECIRKGAFTQSLKENNILALYNHDFNNVLARKDVNMKLVEEDKGLYFEIELPDTTQGNDLYELIDKKIVNQCSFSGYVRKNLWSEDNGGNVLREILEIDLIEITITPIPAYEVTEAEVKRSREIKSTKENKEDKLDFEEIIRESKRKLKEIRESERELNER